MSNLPLSHAEMRFLANGLAPDDEPREYLRYVHARAGRAVTTNGHVAYVLEGVCPDLGNEYQIFSAEGKPVGGPKAPNMDYVLEMPSHAVSFTLSNIEALRLFCAAVQGINKKIEHDWKRTPKKQRSSTTPYTVCVVLRGGDYGMHAEVSSGGLMLRQKISETSGREFSVGLSAHYLADALDALVTGGPTYGVKLTVTDGYNPVWLTYDVASKARVLIMPVRI